MSNCASTGKIGIELKVVLDRSIFGDLFMEGTISQTHPQKEFNVSMNGNCGFPRGESLSL